MVVVHMGALHMGAHRGHTGALHMGVLHVVAHGCRLRSQELEAGHVPDLLVQ